MDVPQARQRIFMISILEGNAYEFPKNKPRTKTFADLLENDVDLKYYLPIDKMIAMNNWKSYQNPFDRLVGRKSICPTLTARGAGEYHSGAIILGNCENNKNIREEIRINPKEAHDKYKPRFLTPREAFRFMGVSDQDYNKLNSIPERQLYKLAGNSIVVQVLEEIFRNLLL